MSETNPDPFPSVSPKVFLEAAGQDRLYELGLSDVRDSPFDTSFADPVGELAVPPGIYDAREALYPTFQGWPHRAMVRATVRLDLGSVRRQVTARAETVDDHAKRLPTQVASFDLGELHAVPEPVLEQLSMVGLRRIIADLEIFNPRGFSGGRIHTAALRAVHAVEQPFDGDYTRLRPRESVLVEGEVVSYVPRRHTPMYNDEDPAIRVRQPDGSIITVSLDLFGELRYGGASKISGVRELLPPHALAGDRVQVIGEVTRPEYANEPLRIMTSSTDGMYLLDASAERQRATLAGHDSINEVLDLLGATSNPSSIRKLIGNYLAGVLSEDKGRVVCNLSAAQKRQLTSVMNLSPGKADPTEEWPIGLSLIESPAMAFRLREAFGKEVFSLTRSEFHNLVRQFACGKYPTVDLQLGQDLFHFSKMAGGELFNDFILGTLNEFYGKYKASLAERSQREPEIDDRLQDAYVVGMLNNVLDSENMPAIGDETKIAARLVEITEDAFDEQSSIPELRGIALHALTQSLLRCWIWEDKFVGKLDFQNVEENPVALWSEEAYRTYARALPRILGAVKAANETAKSFSRISGDWGPYGMRLESLERFTEKLSRFESGGDAR